MRWKEKKIAAFLVVMLFVIGSVWGLLQDDTYHFPKLPTYSKQATTNLESYAIQVEESFSPNINSSVGGRTNYQDKAIMVDESFTSNLPIVVIDTNGQKPKRGVVWDNSKGHYVSTGEDPYVYGSISVIDNKKDVNSLRHVPALQSYAMLKVRGNSSGNYDKQQYLLKLLDQKGKKHNENILGMGSDNEWILNVSFIDKSLLRNYLAYTAAGEVMLYTPDLRSCEVVWKEEGHYRYDGVYYMMESIKVGKNRVDLPRYSENSRVTPTLLRRDRYSLNTIMLDNYATQEELTYGYLGIEYPEQEVISQKVITNITEQVNRFERSLYADTFEEFIRYRDYIDMISFADYFIFNEFFLNYDAGFNSTYFYVDYSGKISMGPVWDFDQAMDNDGFHLANPYTTAFHSAPWFNQMLKDPIFTECIIKRYKELRQSILSDKEIKKFTESAIAYLGPAIERDWARWGYYYMHGNYLKTEGFDGVTRNTTSYQEEVDRILTILSEHGAWLDENLDSLYQFKMISLEDAYSMAREEKTNYKPGLAVAFIGTFLISVKLVVRYVSE